jgi:CRISPR-associated endonuclease/helicase Cas3
VSFPRLLAKSTRTPDSPRYEEALAGHLTIVGSVAATLVERYGATYLETVGLDPGRWLEALGAATVRGAILHDIGKGNDHFQRMIRGQRTPPQAYRHEVVGLWLLCANLDLRRWLFHGQSEAVRYAVLRAVAGHHLKLEPPESFEPTPSGKTEMRILAGHPDFGAALQSVATAVSLPDPPRLANVDLSLVGGSHAIDNPRVALRDLLFEADEWLEQAELEQADETWKRFAAMVAALVVAADVAGSVLPKDGMDPIAWATGALDLVCDGPDLGHAAEKRLNGGSPRPFQAAVAEASGRLVLTTAGCGSGKTVAAYLWAARHAPGRKLFFCYPTTGTATEGFADYAFPEFADDALLAHSRADLDIERVLDNGSDEDEIGLESQGARHRGSRELAGAIKERGLRMWQARLTVCTADTVLGLIQNHRRPLFGSPALLGAGFIFDEIHLYDEPMFGSLLSFLETFSGAPTLLMTATLQPRRRDALRALAARLGETLEEIPGPADLETLERYDVRQASIEDALAKALVLARSGKKVLWVANQVDRATCLAERIEREGVPVELYHSRYRYLDRQRHHDTVVAHFKPECEGGIFAVTTQVCEVSLDLSADLLVTELAPPSSLIQRLGRLNRWATPETYDGPRPALVVDPKGALPYTEHELELGRRWLDGIGTGPVCQRRLSEVFLAVLADEPLADPGPSSWLSGGWQIVPGPLRGAGATIDVIRAEDEPHCRDGQGRPIGKEVTRYTIPMLLRPVARKIGTWQRVGGSLIAPAGGIVYDERWGASWRQG